MNRGSFLRRALEAGAWLPALAGAALLARGGEPLAAPAGADLAICLDVSRSMLARDAGSSRLALAQAEIRALAARAPADRIALVAFAGEARRIVPPTLDGALLADLAEACGPDAVARGGSDLGAAIDAALASLPPDSGRPAAILLLSDGEDLAGEGVAAAGRAAARGARVHALGFGGARGAKIPVPAPGGGERFLRDARGDEVVTGLDEAGLRAVAAAGGGEYRAAGEEPGVLAALYEDAVLPAARASLGEARADGRVPGSALLALAATMWILAIAGVGPRTR